MNQPLKWHGGKHYLANEIVALMPPHTHFVEPYAGGLSSLLAKPCEDISEVVNDLDENLTNFWRVLQSPALFRRFRGDSVQRTQVAGRQQVAHQVWAPATRSAGGQVLRLLPPESGGSLQGLCHHKQKSHSARHERAVVGLDQSY